jgi:hypothetical protein
MSRSEVWTTEEGFVRAETVFLFKQQFRPQVFAVQQQQVERMKNGFCLAMEQLIEATSPILIQTDNLAIEDGVLHGQFG